MSRSFFTSDKYWFDIVFRGMVRNGDVDLLGDSWVVGLGVGFDVIPRAFHGEDISGSAHVVRSYTKTVRGRRVSAIVIAGGPSYTEWVAALAYVRGVRAVIGLGMCGALQPGISIGDVVVPIAAIRGEGTTDYYVDKWYPAIADYDLLDMVVKELRAKGYNPRVGLTYTTVSTFREGPELIHRLRDLGVLCIEGETATLYLLNYLHRIPTVNILVVSDNVIEKRKPTKDELKLLNSRLEELTKIVIDILTRT